MKRITANRCQCAKCEDVIESKHRHDFVSCKCGAIFTDGGTEYIRRGFINVDDIIDLSEFEEQDEKSNGVQALMVKQ